MDESGYPEGWPAPVFLECQCFSDEHVLKWSLDDDSDWPALYASVFLNQYRNVFKRIWVAVKYVFGYKCRYGHWDCFEMRAKDIGRMKALLDAYQEAWRSAMEEDKRRVLEGMVEEA